MNLKAGGGRKMQRYDARTGKYVNNDAEDEALYPGEPLMTAADGRMWVLVHPGKRPPIPIFYEDDRNREYREWWIKTYVNTLLTAPACSIPESKFEGYLFDDKNSNDKSNFLHIIGFDESNKNLLKAQIIEGTLFNQCLKAKPKKFGVNVTFKTRLISPSTGKAYWVITAWCIRTRVDLKFVTLYPYHERKGGTGNE